MQIIAHRGFWTKEEEKNSDVAFKKALTEGFGIETDIRDFNGELVISHNVPTEHNILFEEFLHLYCKISNEVTLALNIKSDGLQKLLNDKLLKYEVKDYFVFDMSVPDSLIYLEEDIISFTRQSEYEKDPSFYDKAKGVWLDEFNGHWITKDIINKHIKNGKSVCIVSPELHKREYKAEWSEYKSIIKEIGDEKIMLCTDYPQEARRYFNEE